jgi:hypothetical protein
MGEPRRCPQCGGSVPVDAPEGGCPDCMFAAGLATGGADAASRLLPRDVLTRPLAEFRLHTARFLEDAANLTETAVAQASADGVRIRFFLERVGEPEASGGFVYGPWFFATWSAVDR